ncbi:MAG: PhzF family phenazine biosynthesis protein [Cellulosilyticum sp.]|nr:PhzF family phenazine biosynthesis protein [Cellulosilyticum sp.]
MKYYIVDAFAENIFEGNPAGVCIMDHWISDEMMQKIAFENNLAETAFAVKEGEHYHIRWFTPGYEIDLCGHATLASSYIIHHFVEPSLEEIKFQSMSGELIVKVEGKQFILDFPSRMPEIIEVDSQLEEILGTKIKEAYLSRDIMVVVEDEEVIQSLTPDFERLRNYELGDGVIITAKSEQYDFVSRCFYPKCGVNEDSVTGSAHCNMIPYWASKLDKDEMRAKQVSPRGGKLSCKLEGDRVKISGSAVLYMIGDIQV